MELCRISNDWLGESYYDITHKSGLRISKKKNCQYNQQHCYSRDNEFRF